MDTYVLQGLRNETDPENDFRLATPAKKNAFSPHEIYVIFRYNNYSIGRVHFFVRLHMGRR